MPPYPPGVSDGDPYWTRVWPSSIALAALILERPELVRGKKVADLGCGLGLAGMAASVAGEDKFDRQIEILYRLDHLPPLNLRVESP